MLHFNPDHQTIWNYLINISYGFLYLYGGVYGILSSSAPNTAGPIKKVMFWLGLALVFWAFALFFWAYYNLFMDIDTPYPSLADALFTLAYPLIGLACFYFIKFFKPLLTPAIIRDAVLFFVLATAFCFYFLNPSLEAELPFWEKFFNLAYPIGDAILLAMALMMLRIGAGKMQAGFWVFLSGLLVMIAADFVFAIRTFWELYWNGGISDLLFIISISIINLSMIMLVTAQKTGAQFLGGNVAKNPEIRV